MKKYIYGVLLLSFAGVSVNAQAADGTITVTAEFFVPTCNVHADSKNMTVQLGNVQRAELKTVGTISTKVPFTLKFTDCATTTGVDISFMGTAAASDDSVFALENPDLLSTAKNVGLQITTDWDTVVKPNYQWNGYRVVQQAGDFSVTYNAAYKALGGDVGAGDANATVEYNVVYK
ncbi:hypothetical protein IV04_19580 [Serratia sp. Ag1]|nr:hypothetical protein JV45_23645 [Serratia sp. Ag2]KFK95938.1 hypothetical protein IV04_19580 [Serratia sp. Ag1]